MENTTQQCSLGLLQDSGFAGDLEDSKSTSGGILCFFGRQTFVPKSCQCKKQTPVSHSSREVEIISLDAGLRMDGIPALILWDLVIQVFHSVPNKNDGPKREPRGSPSAVVKPNMHAPIPIKYTNVIPTNVDHIPPSTTHAGPNAMLYVSEDNEAVIKKDYQRRPTMRNVSRTHRVALDWLCDKINLDPKFRIRYIASTHQFADTSTKGNFTRDEWNHLLHLFNVSHFSSTCCTKNFSLTSSSTMAKRIQEQKEERVVSKSRFAAMKPPSPTATSPSSASSPIASKSPEMPITSGKPDSRMRINPNSFEAVWTSQVQLKDASVGGLMEKQWRNPPHQEEEEDSEDSDNWHYKGKQVAGEPVAQNNEAWEQPLCTRSQFFSCKVKRIQKRRVDISSKYRHTQPIIWKPSSPWSGKSMENKQVDSMEDLDVNLAIWEMFVNTTLRAAVHLGKDFDTNFKICKEKSLENCGTAFQGSGKAGQWSDRKPLA